MFGAELLWGVAGVGDHDLEGDELAVTVHVFRTHMIVDTRTLWGRGSAMIGRTLVSYRPIAVGACVLSFAAALALSARPASAAANPNFLCAQSAVGCLGREFSEFPVPTPESGPFGITSGPNGNVWFSEQGGNKIGRITPSGTITEFPLPTPEGNPPVLALGPDGNVWFTEPIVNKIGRITPTGTITEFPTLTTQSSPQAIIAGPDGNLWLTDAGGGNKGNGQIGRMTLSGTIVEFPILTWEGNPALITAGPDGNLWFTEPLINKIGRITPSGTISEFPLPASTAKNNPIPITAGPDGNVWFTNWGALGNGQIGRITPSGTITEFPIPTESSFPAGITAGPDGNLWFTEEGGYSKVGRITPSGAISEFTLREASRPGAITAGPDGNLWFSERRTNKIGRIQRQLLTPASAAACLVPKLRGKTLTQAKTLLRRAHCKLGAVTKPARRRHVLVVVSQKPAAKKALPSQAKVSLRLG